MSGVPILEGSAPGVRGGLPDARQREHVIKDQSQRTTDGVVDHASLSTRQVSVSIDDGVAIVRLDRADKLNALDVPMLSALVDTGEQLKQDSSVRVVVLSGEGRGFAQGVRVEGMGASDEPASSSTSCRNPS
jgi:Enoyl-CoA hydratase/isomerase